MKFRQRKKIPVIRIIFIFAVFICILSLFFEKKKREASASGNISIYKSEFWLNKIEKPDKLVLSENQIYKLNKRVYRKGFICNPLDRDICCSRSIIKKEFRMDLDWLKHFKKYDEKNRRINSSKLKKRILKIINYNSIPKVIKKKYAVITRPAYLRVFPTYMMIMKKKNDMPFDIFQITFLDTGEPVSLFHVSNDKKWGYVLSAYRRGWVLLKDLGWSYDRKDVSKYINMEKFVLAVDWKIPVYDSDDYENIITYIHMGTKIPLLEKNDDFLVVKTPLRDPSGCLLFVKGYIRNNDKVRLSYLPCTSKNIAVQAFKMLGHPYGWGGLNYKTDCSAYIRRIFLTMGLVLPRNSIQQMKQLRSISFKRRDKEKVLNSITPLQTLLYSADPGHVMLYLGKHNNEHYIIHNKWSYKKFVHSKEKEIFVKRVVVTGLDLGKGFFDGSLRDRLVRISKLK